MLVYLTKVENFASCWEFIEMQFTSMNLIIPKGKSGDFSIKHYRVTKQDVKSARIRQIWQHDEILPKVGKVTILAKKTDSSWKDHDVVMSDSEFDKHANQEIVRIANGNVLIAGLGIGMIILPLLKNKYVKKITVIEREQDVINLVYKHIKKHDKSNKLEIIHDDILKVELPKEKKFDVIFFDIWNDVCGDNYQLMKELRKKFRKHRARYCRVQSWQEQETRKLDRE